MKGSGTGTAAFVSILVFSACLLPTAFPLAPNLESLTPGTRHLLLLREVHTAQQILEARVGAQGLFQLRVLRLGFLQDGDVGVSVFPEGEEILIGGAGFGCVALQGVSTR
jgi:hypothetical protein